MVAITHHLDETATAVLGKILVETLSGNLTDSTLDQLRELPTEEMPQPFRDFTKAVGGSALTGDELLHTAFVELRFICDEMITQL